MYIYNVDKEGCVKVPAILSQKNGQKYKLLSAEDISWNVTLKDKDRTVISTTDDLLDYITGMSYGGGDSPVNPDRYTIYYIQCDVTVCYEGTVFDYSPEIKVFKNTGYDIDDVTYQYLKDHGIYVRITCSGDPNDQLIIFDDEKQCLNGIAKPGTYTLELLQGEGQLVTAYKLTVLSKPTQSNVVIVYTQQETRPAKPEGGSYDFENKQLTSPEGWSDNILDFQAGGSIWFSVGTMYSNSSPVWSSPSLYITESSFEPKYENRSIGVSVYTCVPNTSTFVAPNTPVGGQFDTTSQTLICPNHWYITPEEAIEAYKQNAQEQYVDRFVTYVSFNNYILKYEKTSNEVVSIDETGWSTPSKYLNIAQILDDASSNANTIVSDAITGANQDLQDAIDQLIDDLGNLGDDFDGLSSLVKDLNDNYGQFSQVSVIIDSLTVLYSWEECLQSDVDESKRIQLTQEQYDSITIDNIQDILSGPDYFDKYVILKDGKYYHYTATSASLINQISALRKSLEDAKTELSTAISEITPDYIRLQASTGYLSDVTWTLVSNIPANATQHVVDNLPATDYVYGDYYIVGDNEYRCDYPISTGLLKILSDKITLAVTRTTNGNTISSTINMTVGDEGSKIEVDADDIVLNGDVIAAAIASKELNIDNYTYLYSRKQAGENGPMAIFGGETSGTTIFNADGSGQLGGGNLTWNNTGDVTVTGTINASAGQIGKGDNAWFIGTIGPETAPIPAIYAKDNDGYKIVLSTERLEGGLEANPSWMILNDGTATFANGNVIFNNDGTGRIGSDETNITINENGDISLVGINITLSSEDRTQIINDAADGAKGLVINEVGTSIIGQLNTEDVSIGNGSCFFKGTDVANDEYGYSSGTKGSGHLANRNIYWDSAGNVTMNGDIRATSFEAAVSVTNSIWLTSVEKIIRILAGDDQDKQNAVRASLTSAGVDVDDLDFPVMVVRIDDTYYVMNITKISTRMKTILTKQTYRTIYPIVNVPLYYDQEFPDVYYKDPNLTQLMDNSILSYDTDPTDTRLLSEFFFDLDGTDPRVMTNVTNYQGTWNKYIRRFSGYYTVYHNRRTNTYSNGKLQQSSSPITEMYCIDGTYQAAGRTFDMWDSNSFGLLGVTTFGAHYNKDVYGDHNKLCVYFVDDITSAGSLFESVEADYYDQWSTDCIIELNSIIRQYTISSNLDELVDRIAECINRHKRGIAADPQASRGALIRRIGNLYMYNLTYYSGWSLRYESCGIIIGMMDSIYLRM